MDSIQLRNHKAKQSNKYTAKWNPKKALFPLFPLARYMGVYPCDSNWIPTAWWLKYSKWVLLFPILMDVYQLIYGITMPDEVMAVAMFNIVLHEVRVGCEMVSLCGHLYTLIENPEIVKILSDHLKSRIPRKKEYLFCAKHLASFVVFNFFLGTFVLNWKTVWTKNIIRRILITGVSITNTYVTFLTVMFCSIMEVITMDFKRVISSVEKGGDLKCAIQQHQFLNDLCNKSGRLFSLHLIGHCMKISVTIVQDVHLSIQNLLLPQSDLTITFASASGVQTCYEFTNLYIITTYSEEVHSEVLGGCITYIVIVIQLSRTGE